VTAPFIPLANAQRISLTADRFKAGNQVLGLMSSVAYYDGPLGHLLIMRGGDPFRFYLKAAKDFAVAAGQAAGDYLVDLGATGLHMVRTPRPAADLPTSVQAGQGDAGTVAHPDVLAYTSLDNGQTWQPAAVRAVDFVTGKVTLTVPANVTNIRVYFVPADGEFQFRVIRPVGSDSMSAQIFGQALRSIHETEQNNVRSAPQLGDLGREYPIPPQFRLDLAVRSNARILWDNLAQHEISLPMYDTPIRVTDYAALTAQAEVKLRGGSI